MKYIEVSAETETNKVIIFSEDINHDAMFECVRRMRKKLSTGWIRRSYKVVSAGFVNSDNTVYGMSETLRIGSRKEAEQYIL